MAGCELGRKTFVASRLLDLHILSKRYIYIILTIFLCRMVSRSGTSKRDLKSYSNPVCNISIALILYFDYNNGCQHY